jgi:hypothetical protein
MGTNLVADFFESIRARRDFSMAEGLERIIGVAEQIGERLESLSLGAYAQGYRHCKATDFCFAAIVRRKSGGSLPQDCSACKHALAEKHLVPLDNSRGVCNIRHFVSANFFCAKGFVRPESGHEGDK